MIIKNYFVLVALLCGAELNYASYTEQELKDLLHGKSTQEIIQGLQENNQYNRYCLTGVFVVSTVTGFCLFQDGLDHSETSPERAVELVAGFELSLIAGLCAGYAIRSSAEFIRNNQYIDYFKRQEPINLEQESNIHESLLNQVYHHIVGDENV